MSNVKIAIQKLQHGLQLPLPSYATIGSAGMDLVAAIEEEKIVEILPMQVALIPTGIAMALPRGFEAQVRPRSGLAIKYGITVINSPGTIDSDYRGEIFVALINLSQKAFEVTYGMRIAQVIIAQYGKIDWDVVESLDRTARGDGGFGSTGMK